VHLFKGKTALITGASRGIGRELALAFARQGAAVAICARSQEGLDKVQKEIEAAGSHCFASVCDVRQEKQVKRFVSQVEDKFGAVSILINNAGIYVCQPVLKHSTEIWQDVMDTNLNSSFFFSRQVLPSMTEAGWGRIINISSVSGKKAESYGAAYSASKFAMIGLTQALALEVAKQGITVNAICPGWVGTEMAHNQLVDDKWCELNQINPHESHDIHRLSVPQERFVEGQEVAELACYLASDQAKSITGQAINICGGLSLC
jgi:ketoreductase